MSGQGDFDLTDKDPSDYNHWKYFSDGPSGSGGSSNAPPAPAPGPAPVNNPKRNQPAPPKPPPVIDWSQGRRLGGAGSAGGPRHGVTQARARTALSSWRATIHSAQRSLGTLKVAANRLSASNTPKLFDNNPQQSYSNRTEHGNLMEHYIAGMHVVDQAQRNLGHLEHKLKMGWAVTEEMLVIPQDLKDVAQSAQSSIGGGGRTR